MDQPTTMQRDFIERLCCTHAGQLQNYLTEMVGSRDVARELAEHSFEQMCRVYRPEQVLFPRAALFKVATNFALMHLRKRRVGVGIVGATDIEKAEEVPDHRVNPDQRVSAEQLGDWLALAITALRPSIRKVFVMAHVQGVPRKEIAAALGISERRVDKRLTAALRKCREHLLTHGFDLTEVLGLVALVSFAWALSVH